MIQIGYSSVARRTSGKTSTFASNPTTSLLLSYHTLALSKDTILICTDIYIDVNCLILYASKEMNNDMGPKMIPICRSWQCGHVESTFLTTKIVTIYLYVVVKSRWWFSISNMSPKEIDTWGSCKTCRGSIAVSIPHKDNTLTAMFTTTEMLFLLSFC